MMLGVYGNAKAHKDVYFPTPGYYLTGDGAIETRMATSGSRVASTT